MISCSQTPEHTNKMPVDVKETNYTIHLHFTEQAKTINADTLFLRFRISDKMSNRKQFWGDLQKAEINIRESGGNPPDFNIKPITHTSGIQAERISQDVAFWFMVDRSKTIAPQDMERMKTAIMQTIEILPDSCAFISFFDKQPGEKKLVTKNNFYEFENEFKVKPESRDLYQNIIHNFELFAKDNSLPHKDGTKIAKYLLIFTDGHINSSSKEEIERAYKSDEYIKQIDHAWQNQIQIYAFRYGSFDFADLVLNDICLHRQKSELNGGFYPADNVAGIVDSLTGFVDNLSADYELMLVNPSGKVYAGTKQTLQILIDQEHKKAVGQIEYSFGSKENPIVTGATIERLYIAVIVGLIIIFIAFFIMQVVIPYFISRITNFEKKYVKPYQPITTSEGEVYETCSFCQEPLETGELIVTKCPHKIHWECWIENGYKCVEYGQNCKDGMQYHFDKNHPFDPKQSPYYLKWAISGMISGFFIWIIFHLSSKLNLFSKFIDILLNTFYPEQLKENIEGQLQILRNVELSFYGKISGLLLAGILLGFLLTFMFTYINDFRVKTGKVIFSIFFRALTGAIAGFASFLIGAIICIALGEDGNKVWLDAIPWLLFGGSIALCLVYNTTLKWQDALIGGLISGIVSFLILYTTHYLPAFGPMFGFMLCSTGLGISIIARHHLAQKFFLKYKGERREGIIAIHKWMNDSGGSNEVIIGKSNHCTIQMNWDSSNNIADKQVKLYIDPKRKVPMMKVIENGMTYENRDARKDDQLPLKHGVKFIIGNTDFQYIEK